MTPYSFQNRFDFVPRTHLEFAYAHAIAYELSYRQEPGYAVDQEGQLRITKKACDRIMKGYAVGDKKGPYHAILDKLDTPEAEEAYERSSEFVAHTLCDLRDDLHRNITNRFID